MSQMNNGAFQNPYANFVPNTPLGGYNPNLYTELAILNKAAADKAQALINTQTDFGGGGGGDGGDSGGGDSGDGGGDSGGGDSGDGGGGGSGGGGAAYAKGGMVRGLLGPNPPGPDDGAGYLDRGEYVIKKSSVKKYGRGLLDMINEGKVPAKKIRSLLD
jgi:hypothetical protein